MDVILDACSLVNLINGNSLDAILLLPEYHFFIGQVVLDECSKSKDHESKIKSVIDSGELFLYPDDVNFFDFLNIRNKYNLGDGESECIAICKQSRLFVSSDDRKARACAKKEIDPARVIGSLYLLRQTVRENILSCQDAINNLIIMKVMGGFLPNVDATYLCR